MTAATGDPSARHERARHGDEETRYRAVAELDPADPGDRAVLLERLADPSWRVRAAAVERIAVGGVVPGILPGLAEALAAGPNVGARDAAAAALARLGPAAVPPLVERLGAEDPEMRQAAAGVLGAIGDRRAVAPLTARLADADPNVRAAVAEALGKIGGSEATGALRAAVDSDDAMLRLTAVEALVQLHACVSHETLLRLLADRGMRRPAYRLLGSCDDPAALLLVARGLAEPSRAAREAALAALGQQRTRKTPQDLAPVLSAVRAAADREPALADAWAASLASDEPLVAMGALAALGVAGRARHVAAMLRLAEDDRHRTLVDETLEALPPEPELRAALAEALPGLGQLARLAALAALARLGSPAAFESLVREASDAEAYGQADGIAALGRLGDLRGVAPLAGLLGDDAPQAAGLAATALGRISQSGAAGRAAVLAALRDRAGASPSAALYRTIGAVGDADDLVLLRAGLRGESVAHRSAAAAAVAALARRGLLAGTEPAELVAALSDREWPVRVAAARAFAEIGRAGAAARGGGEPACAKAVEALRSTLRDPEPAARAAAAEALGACARAESADEIAALADDPAEPPQVVVAALHALYAFGAARADVFARAARHADPEVVKAAVRAAARVPGAEGERLLRDAAASPRWDVRQTAARAMADRGDAALRDDAARLAEADPDPLVARAFAEAARALGR